MCLCVCLSLSSSLCSSVFVLKFQFKRGNSTRFQQTKRGEGTIVLITLKLDMPTPPYILLQPLQILVSPQLAQHFIWPLIDSS